MTNAVHSKSTTLKLGVNVVAELTNIGGISLSADTVEVTTLGSTDEYKEFIQGFRDGGEVSISGNFYPGDTLGQFALLTSFNAGTLDTYTITFPPDMGATWTYTAIMTAYTTGADVGGAVTFTATMKVSGKPLLGVTVSGGLTALSLTGATGTLAPAFSAALRSYTFTGVTASTFTVTPTAASHTIKLYVDGVFVEKVTSGSASTAISLTTGISKLVTLVVNEVGKTAITYNIIVD